MVRHSRPALRSRLHRTYLAAVVLLAAVMGACDRSSPSGPSPLPTNPGGSPPRPTFPAGPPSGPTGSYTLTLTASPTCAIVTDSVTRQPLPFPESVRVRRYAGEFADGAATLTAMDGTGNQVHIGGTDYYSPRNPRPLMTVTGTELTIIVPGHVSGPGLQVPSCAGGDYWWEILSEAPGDNEGFELCGTWRGSMEDPARIEGTIDGTFAYYRGVVPPWTTVLFCVAPDHRFTLTKR